MLTPYVGDANIETPEYKAFLVDVEPIAGPTVLSEYEEDDPERTVIQAFFDRDPDDNPRTDF